MIKNFEHARNIIATCSEAKSGMESLNGLAENYANYQHKNFASSVTDYLRDINPQTLPPVNIIRLGIRVWMSVVMSAPFGVEVLPAGARDREDLKKLAADGANNVIKSTRQTPQDKSMFRKLAWESLVNNLVFLYDGMDYATAKYPQPFKRIVTWRDCFWEANASGPINDEDGPNTVAVRLWLHEDEFELRFPKAILKDAQRGLGAESRGKENTAKLYEDLIPVIEFWGIDRGVQNYSRRRMKNEIDEAWDKILSGDRSVPVVKEQPHDAAMEIGDAKIMALARERYGIDKEDFGSTMTEMSMMGDSTAENYSMWRYSHMVFSQNGFGNGLAVKKYPDSIYHCAFQPDGEDFLLEPEPSPYKHGQIPISASSRQEGSAGYMTPSLMAEALDKQAYIEYLRQEVNIHLHFQARPALFALMDALPENYRNPEGGREQLLTDIITGFKLFELRGLPPGVNPRDVLGFIQPGAISMDVRTEYQQNMNDLLELFGASEIMRGIGPGAEASGKHIQLRMGAASRPTTFMLSMLEGPMYYHYQRYSCYLLEYTDPQWLQQFVNEEQLAAIMSLRNTGGFAYATKVQLGAGMPTEWIDRKAIYFELLQMGYISPKGYVREMEIPVSESELLQAPTAMMPSGGNEQTMPPTMPRQPVNYGA